MKLPDNAIGITDVLSWRDCARRFAFGMRRHTEAGEHPEAQTAATAYGSAIHEAIAYAESAAATDGDAIQRAFDQYGRWLDPADLERLRDDMRTYRQRDYTGVRTVAVEREIRVPLFEHEGQTIYFRGKLDRLYQRRDNPSVFVHIDYKSSRHPKTDAEVHSDLQLWAYNWLIHQYWPECETLVQVYDQLAFGPVPTRKSPEQREEIREWLIRQITAILHDDVLAPTKNRWCAWCPIMESCPIVGELTLWARAQIGGLGPIGADVGELDQFVARLEDVAEARKILERYEDSVKDVLRDMPDVRRARLGYELGERRATRFTPDALRTIHELVGDEDFYALVGLTKTRAEKHPQSDELLALAEQGKGSVYVRRRRAEAA